MAKKVRVSDESLNVYGFWVKTSGIDTSDFLKNPIMLWNHSRTWLGTEEEVLPIGIWNDLVVSGSEMTAVPEFDTEDEFANKVAVKFDKGHLRAASIGIQILEWSEDPSMLKSGQTRPTVTKCKLREISIVDIPANKNAVTLYDMDGKVLNLTDAGSLDLLPTLTLASQLSTEMEELKKVAVSLGLHENATVAEIQKAISDLRADASKNAADLKAFKDQQLADQKAQAKTLLDEAVKDGRVQQNLRGNYEKLFDADFESAKSILEGLKPVQKLSEFAKPDSGSGEGTYQGKTFSQLRKESPKVLETLKAQNFELFNQLYKAEYGKNYKVDQPD